MYKYRVRLQVIKTYTIVVEAEDEDEAIKKVERMQTLTIQEKGEFEDAYTDYIEVEGKED